MRRGRDRLRRERRFLSLDALRPGHREAGSATDPAGRLEDAELAALVRDAMRRLPARYRELIVLCDHRRKFISQMLQETGGSFDIGK